MLEVGARSVRLSYTLKEVLAAVAIITRHVIGPWDKKSSMRMGYRV